MKKKLFALTLVVVLAMLGALTGCGSKEEVKDEAKDDGKISAKIILILEDGEEIPYDIRVKKDSSLRDALYEAKLIDEENYSALFVETIDGHTSAVDDGRTWEVLNENKEHVDGFFENIILEDGQTIYLQDILVPNFDD